MSRSELKRKVTRYAKSLGAELVGYAPVSRWNEYGEVPTAYRPQHLWPQAKTIIVLGTPMLLPMLETTPSINHGVMYDTTNDFLDRIAYQLSLYLNRLGYASIFSPRDGYGDVEVLLENPVGCFSHVYAGKYAGLGTIGYSHNLINKQYGPRVRYVSIFTELDVEGDPLVKRDLCTKCLICQKLCPSNAFTTQEDRLIADFDKMACTRHHEVLGREKRWPCGVCIKVCPIGEDRKLYQSRNIQLYLDEPEVLQKNPDDERYSAWVHVRKHGSKGNRIF
ncbi:epoxyqueuosine reductase [Heliobacterium chlorum]|uniref:Epoxyqueuosine reductase n=1 Tax=Heliobacterium chlorum TaxID=2698 RepID=A0ABR7T6A0_HELCL|nr:epoxyqueuosine reductase [Heliobacterium chlorum]